jgi:hypothetical protein
MLPFTEQLHQLSAQQQQQQQQQEQQQQQMTSGQTNTSGDIAKFQDLDSQ